MLTRDQELFERRYTEAASFVRAAEKRSTCYTLCCRGCTIEDIAEIRSLLRDPACRESWFVVQLRGDAPRADRLLEEAGL